MKKIIRLTESDLHRIVKNSVKKILKEKKDDSKPGFDVNSKRTKNRFWNGSERYDHEHETDSQYKEAEGAAKEFLNRPNAAQDFEHFPRQSVQRNHDYDSLSNGKLHKQNIKNLEDRRAYQDRQSRQRKLDNLCRRLRYHGEVVNITDEEIQFLIDEFNERAKYSDNSFFYDEMDMEAPAWFYELDSYLRRYYNASDDDISAIGLVLSQKCGFDFDEDEFKINDF